MLEIRSSTARRQNAALREVPRKRGEGNAAWLQRQRGDAAGPCLLLLGGTDALALRLRVAQSHLRHDLTPSRWSHVVLFPDAGSLGKRRAGAEISLAPPAGFGFPPPTNAVQRASADAYDDAAAFPNVALLLLPVEEAAVRAALERFQRERAALDGVELLVRWLAFAWGAGSAGNPLLEGLGLPSAAMVEQVAGAAGYPLAPGVSSRTSCPEALWQSARWWHEYQASAEREPLRGAWCAEHRLVP